MAHTISIQGEVLDRSEVMLRLQQIADVNKENVWIGRNLKVIENTWYQRLIWNIFARFCNFEWCKNLYNVDDEKSKNYLLEIKQVFKGDRELTRIFVQAVLYKFNYHVSNTDCHIALDPFEQFCFEADWEKELFRKKGVLTFSSDDIQTAAQLEYLLDLDPTIDHLIFCPPSGYRNQGLSWDRKKMVEFISLIAGDKYSSRIKGISLGSKFCLGESDGFNLEDKDLAPLKNVPLQTFKIMSYVGMRNLKLTPACLQQLNTAELSFCDLSGFRNDLRNEHLTVLANAPLKFLRFGSKNVTGEGLNGLNLGGLKSFFYKSGQKGPVKGGHHGDKFLEILGAKASALIHLNMEDAYVTKEGLRHMRAQKLECLTLRNSNASQEELLEALSDVNVSSLIYIDFKKAMPNSALNELRSGRNLPLMTENSDKVFESIKLVFN
ncbi:MAG: hypothetical protein P4L16_08400 [Chlamydiales bacterium]|nr:hypothetical protein [Chlamydiales bacterium]